MNITVVGTGYVGLSLACLLAQHNEVRTLDIIPEKVEKINNGIAPIKDAEISKFLASGQLNLKASLDSAWAYEKPDFVIIATPTNYDEQKNNFDTSSIEEEIDKLDSIGTKACIVIKSTIPMGYTEELSSRHPNLKIIFSPEFLREGTALYDNLHPTRIVTGVPKDHKDELDPYAEHFIKLLEEGAEDTDIPTLSIGATEAEAIKLFSNTYLAIRVSYFNELDTYADSRGLNSEEIIKGVGLDPRIGSYYSNPSFGYGGYCLPKDTKQLLANYGDVPQDLIGAVVQSNATREAYIARRIAKLKPKHLGIHRLVMKKGSDNFRASAIQGVMTELSKLGVDFVIYEPLAEGDSFDGHPVTKNLESFKHDCDVIVSNRTDENLADVASKVYTRDLWNHE